MLTKTLIIWPLLFLMLHQTNAKVKHLSNRYLTHDKEQTRGQQSLADEIATPEQSTQSNDGAYYPMSGLMLPSGYNIPTGSNVPPSPMLPPNFQLPIYPPFFGFNGGGGGGGGQGFGQVPPGYESQFNNGPFPVGPQGAQYTAGPQGGGFPQPGPFQQTGQFAQPGNPFHAGQQGAPFPGNPYPGGPQPGSFPVGSPPSFAQMGPFSFPTDLNSQGFPGNPMQFAFQPNVGSMYGMPGGFGGPQQPSYPFQQQVNVGQPFSPNFGQQYQPQQFADELEPELETSEKLKSSSAKKLAKLRNKETIYASNGGYIYKRSK